MSDQQTALDVLKGSRLVAYTIGAVCLVAGLVLLFWPDRTWTVVARVAGILLVVLGVGQLVESIRTHRTERYWAVLLLRGVINLAVGLVLVFWPSATVTVVVWLLGLDLLVTGLLGLVVSFQVPKDLGRTSLLVQSGVTIVLGILIMAWPSATLNVISVIIAVLLLITAAVMLWTGYQLTQVRRDVDVTAL